ncbi:OB-fold nucleic acid binding domain-containing protein, partial [Acinetobacter baumannii]
HPLDAYQSALQRLQCLDSALLADATEGSIRLAGVALAKQERMSKNGQKFAFVQCSDPTGFFEVAVFSEVFARTRDLLQPGQLLL